MALVGPDPSFLKTFAETRGFLLGRPGRFQITPDGGAVLFLRTDARSSTSRLFELDLRTGTERELVAPERLAEGDHELGDAEKARRERQRITDRGVVAFDLSPDGATVLIPFAGRLFLCERNSENVRCLVGVDPSGEAPLDPRFSPDGSKVAFVRAGDVWAVDVAADAGPMPPSPITSGATPERSHGLAEMVAQEEMGRSEGYWWSPDGRSIAYAIVDETDVERFAIADPSRPERAPAFFRYPRAGLANARVRLGIAAVAEPAFFPREPLRVRWDFERYPYLARVLWQGPRAPLVILVQTRDQREQVLLAVDETTGATRSLLVERDPAWLNLERGLPRWLPDGSGLLLVDESDNRRRLVLHDPSDGHHVEITDQGFLSLVHVDTSGADVAVMVLEGDALTNRLVRITLGTGARTVLLDDGHEHDVVASRDGGLVVDTRVGSATLPETVVRRAGGPTLLAIRHASETPPFRANLDLVTVEATPPGASAPLTYHAALVRPRGFEPGMRLPVVVYVYGGPHALAVKADERSWLFAQWLADHGVIVVAMDNRGTPRRGPAWERSIKYHLGASALDDQVAALTALGSRYAELDLSRVGIYGWSFGGTMAALAVLRRPDVFSCAVAGAPVVDWTDYDTHYTERYMDLPNANPDGYAGANLLTYANTLERPLLLVHGTADDNVYFFHSLKLADALMRAGRRFDFLPLSGATHQLADPIVRERLWGRVADYLLGHLTRTA